MLDRNMIVERDVVRAEINAQIAAFLEGGGKIESLQGFGNPDTPKSTDLTDGFKGNNQLYK